MMKLILETQNFIYYFIKIYDMTVTAYPVNKKQEKAIKAFFEALEVPFKITKDESPYNAEFVELVLQGSQDIRDGKGITINVDDLWK